MKCEVEGCRNEVDIGMCDGCRVELLEGRGIAICRVCKKVVMLLDELEVEEGICDECYSKELESEE